VQAGAWHPSIAARSFGMVFAREDELVITTRRPDLCVIDEGSAGYAAAAAARAHGRDVLVISRPGDLGGTCIRRGCMPAKSVLASTEALGRVEKAPAVGVDPGRVEVDLQAIVDRKTALVEYFVEARREDFADIPYRNGIARFVDETAIDVSGERIEAHRFLVATGSHILPPAIPGLGQIGVFTSDDAIEMTEVPRSMVGSGAGPVG